MRVFSAVLDLFWPVRCVACGNRFDAARGDGRDAPFCDDCAETLLPIGAPCCPRCGIAFQGAGPSHLCGECLFEPPPFREARAVFQYGAAARDAALRLKYGGVSWIGASLGKSMLAVAREMARPDIILPVPLHPVRLRSRGFNQSALTAGVLASHWGCPLDTRTLRRVRNTPPQARLTREERKRNIRGAFAASSKNRLAGQRVLLVDDVITTGVTVREASRVLLLAGAAVVEVIAFARAC